MKKYNFNAGPSMLPREVIENTAKQILDFNGSGLSLMEISHRAKDFQPVVDEAVSLFKELLDIPEGYSVIFLGGGASLQFMQIPANFLIKKAAYINSGTWAKKAMKEAKHFGEVVEIASSSDANFTFYPQVPNTVPADCDYLHLTSNNTIYGTELRVDPDVNVPLISDMSSDIMSRPVDVSKYTAIYAGAQKNLSMAGVTVIIVKDDMLGKAPRELPTMLDYRTHVEKGSMFNTAIDSAGVWNINTFTTLAYTNAVGYLSLDGKTSQKNTTKQTQVGERIAMGYRNNWLEVNLNGTLNYNHARNKLQASSNMNTWQFSYGPSITATMPWGMSLSTDLSQSSRRGYSDKSMNTNELVWNAQLSQGFLKGKPLTVMIQFYDLLHQQSTLSRALTAMARTDTEYNSINSYAMLHVTYRLNIIGGKQARETMRYGGRPDFGGRPFNGGRPPMGPPPGGGHRRF